MGVVVVRQIPISELRKAAIRVQAPMIQEGESLHRGSLILLMVLEKRGASFSISAGKKTYLESRLPR